MKNTVKVIDKRGVGATYYLKRKYRLKKNVKAGICLLVFGILIIGILFIQAKRVEDLENNENNQNESITVNFTK